MSKSRIIFVAASIACWWLPAFSVSAQDITERDTSFNNEGYTFAGTLLYAANRKADDKSPAVIMVHGSGDGPRHQFRPMAETYARNGFVVLIYDKRDNWANVPLTTLWPGESRAGSSCGVARTLL